MYQTSLGLSNAIMGDARTFISRMALDGSPIDNEIISIKYVSESNSGETIALGSTVSTYIDVEMIDTDTLIENRELELLFGMDVNGVVEYVPMGWFTIQKPVKSDGTIKFTAVDRFQSRMNIGFFSNLSYPADGVDVLTELSMSCGMSFDTALPRGTSMQTKPEGYTCREVVGYLSQMYGCFAKINRSGNLELGWYATTEYEISEDRSDTPSISEQDFVLGKLECSVSEEIKITSGIGSGSISFSNPFMTQQLLDAAFTKISGFAFREASIYCNLGDIRLDTGDIVTITDSNGSIHALPIMSLTHEFDGGISSTLSGVGKSQAESENETKGPITLAMDRLYSELFIVNLLVANKIDVDVVVANYASIGSLTSAVARIGVLESNEINVDYMNAHFASIDLANIAVGTIKTAMIETGAIGTVQIADGSITDAKIVELTANKINAGTLSVERLIITGSTQSIVYSINEASGTAQLSQATIDGGALTQRTITADRIVVDAITANEIAANTITANEIAALSITASEIAVGAITASKISVSDLQAIGATIAGWGISTSEISKVYSFGGITYSASIRSPISTETKVFDIMATDISKFYVTTLGKLFSSNAEIEGIIKATSAWISNEIFMTSGAYISGGNWDRKVSVMHYNNETMTVPLDLEFNITKIGDILHIKGDKSFDGISLFTSDVGVTGDICATGTIYARGGLQVLGPVAAKKIQASGTYVVAANRYNNSALQIRENDLIGAGSSDIGYAPTIGFHWGSVRGATLSMGYDGTFNFITGSGGTWAAIKSGSIVVTGAISATTTISTSGTISTTGRFSSSGVYNMTTTAAANIGMGSDTFMYRSTSSSRRYKTDIYDLQDEALLAERLYDIKVRQFKFNTEYLSNKDDRRYGVSQPGFIVEEMEQVYPIAVDYNQDNTPEMWNFKMLIPPMLKLIQDQHSNINDITLCSSINKTNIEQLANQIITMQLKIAELQQHIKEVAA